MTALTQSNKDKADIALDDAENAQYAKKAQFGRYSCLILNHSRKWQSITLFQINWWFFIYFDSYVSHVVHTIDDQCTTIGLDSFSDCLNQQHSNLMTSRRRTKTGSGSQNSQLYTASQQAINQANALSQWKRIMLLVIIEIVWF